MASRKKPFSKSTTSKTELSSELTPKQEKFAKRTAETMDMYRNRKQQENSMRVQLSAELEVRRNSMVKAAKDRAEVMKKKLEETSTRNLEKAKEKAESILPKCPKCTQNLLRCKCDANYLEK